MARNEWSELLQVLDASSHEQEIDASLRVLLKQSFGGGSAGLDSSLLPRLAPAVTARRVEPARTASPAPVIPAGARGVDELLSGYTPAGPATPVSTATSDGAERGENSGASVAKTIGTFTGVGPLAAGLMKLFGRGGSDAGQDAAPTLPFSLPEQISVEAGLSADRSFVPVTYSQRGVSRTGGTPQAASAPPAQVLVNVQAMDSRSFLDHSDDIARAVRDAMLRSHSLNDVVAEM